MRKLLFPLLLLLLGSSLQAQDLIIDKKGYEYNCIIRREDSASVKAKLIRNGEKKDTIFLCIDIDTCQYAVDEIDTLTRMDAKFAQSFGLGFGASTILGTSLEYKFSKRFGVEVGGGFLVGSGAQASINLHMSPSIRSSYFALNYWCQGVGVQNYQQTSVGPSFVFRGRKWITVQLGAGFIVDKGPHFNKGQDVPATFILAIGGYIPLM